MFTGTDWKPQEIRVPGLAEPISHYTDVVVAGPLVFISGCAALDATGAVPSDDVREQTRQVHENLSRCLEAAGCDFSSVVKVVVYLTDVGDRHVVNEVRREYFGETRPVSTLIGVAELAIPALKVEIEAIAVRPESCEVVS